MTPAPARLVIGVTGHRKLPDKDRLAAKIDAAIDEIVRRAPGQGTAGAGAFPAIARPRPISPAAAPARLVVISPLAEGADRLVAERVLARDGAELEAVLPMPEPDYEKDFETDTSRAEFRALLARAAKVHRLSGSSSREAAYAAAGRFVVDHCDVLIAIWNGQTANGPGGTADIVACARSRRRRLLVIEP